MTYCIKIAMDVFDDKGDPFAEQVRHYDVESLAELPRIIDNAGRAMAVLIDGVKVGLDADNSR